MKGKVLLFSTILNGIERVVLYPCPDSHLFVFSLDDVKRVAEKLRVEDLSFLQNNFSKAMSIYCMLGLSCAGSISLLSHLPDFETCATQRHHCLILWTFPQYIRNP